MSKPPKLDSNSNACCKSFGDSSGASSEDVQKTSGQELNCRRLHLVLVLKPDSPLGRCVCRRDTACDRRGEVTVPEGDDCAKGTETNVCDAFVVSEAEHCDDGENLLEGMSSPGDGCLVRCTVEDGD
eukprot:CAMPEP_0115575046 /NCGR_PEP_ID=MMETSP0272-20121206/1835_1 /TAXON_ID=71861 /ORGANISM="Scrippsiella trochoidea, Strain CCMP3099" /LENGTH=126 /DNA_ID=CAMNT_0003009775 /DNA_START=176 /DNA_END=557 /DNA_ORIENTATION=+